MTNERLIQYLKQTDCALLPREFTENETRDFKRKCLIGKSRSKERAEFLKDAIAFANSNGRKLAVMFFGIEEIREQNGKKIGEFEIIGVENDDKIGIDNLKNILKDTIYPAIHADVITIYNGSLQKTVQILTLEHNTDRPYMLKRTIIKGTEYVEGSKFYREVDSSTRIPSTDEDRLIAKWKHEDRYPSPPEQSQASAKEAFLVRILDGTQLLNIVINADAYEFAHDDLKSETEVELVGTFLQNMRDYGDILSHIEMGERVKLTYEFSKYLNQLKEKGCRVFGGQDTRRWKMNNEPVDINVAILQVYRETNSEIIQLPLRQEGIFSQN